MGSNWITGGIWGCVSLQRKIWSPACQEFLQVHYQYTINVSLFQVYTNELMQHKMCIVGFHCGTCNCCTCLFCILNNFHNVFIWFKIFSEAEIKQFLREVTANDLILIPLVQTFGHLEVNINIIYYFLISMLHRNYSTAQK